MATKVVLHIIVLVFVLAKSPQSACCQPKCQLCVCVHLCVCESLLDLMMHATDANHQFTQLSSASASASASASGSAPSSVCTPICWFILPLSRQRLLLSLLLLPSSRCCCCCQLANGILFAKHIRNFAWTLSARYLCLCCFVCALELWAPVYYCGPIMIICLSSVPVH